MEYTTLKQNGLIIKMSNTSIPLPPEYKNRSKGRILQDLCDTQAGVGHLYEDTYSAVRTALQNIKNENPALFQDTVTHIVGGKPLSEEKLQKARNHFDGQGVSIGSATTLDIVRDWQKQNFNSSYQPKYMLDVGVPVQKAFYEEVAGKILNIRENHPEFSSALDKLISSNSDGRQLVNPETWYKEEIDDNQSTARAFARAVSPLSGGSIAVARDFVKRDPAQSFNL